MKIESFDDNKVCNAIDCLICGEPTTVANVNYSHYQYVVCDKCKSAILQMRKIMMDSDYSKDCIIKLIDESENVSYIITSPKMVTPNSIQSKMRILKEEYVKGMYHFTCNQDEAMLFSRTKAQKICKSFSLLQKNGYFNQFVRAEVLRDNQVVHFSNFRKDGEE